MTDKQIIIDGVDVSGCGFYHSKTGTECHIALAFAEEYTDDNHTYFKCEQNPNCYYKQLKLAEQRIVKLNKTIQAKEQECHEYSKELARFQQEVVPKLRKRLRDKEQECERLKEDNDYEVGALEKTIDNLKSENKHLNDLLNQALKDYEKARETLTEIKEILKRCGKRIPLFETDEIADDLKQILQKISEVEDEN